MSIAAIITEGIGPGGSVKYALTLGFDLGAGPIGPWTDNSGPSSNWTPNSSGSNVWTDISGATTTWTNN